MHRLIETNIVCLMVFTPLSTIFQLYRGGHFIGGGPGENH
jgi:hypothetical protein